MSIQSADRTYSGGGHPHTFVELFGGYVVPMSDVEPDVFSFRHNYYYNSGDNQLYIKQAEWVSIDKGFDKEDLKYVYYNGRAVLKTVRTPDPKYFGDKYYYSLVLNRVFGRTFKWVKCNNL